MKCVLIVNPNGHLSACPTAEQFATYQFVTAGMVVFEVEMSEVVLFALKLAADKIWFVGLGLPRLEPKEGRTYFVVHEGRLWTYSLMQGQKKIVRPRD